MNRPRRPCLALAALGALALAGCGQPPASGDHAGHAHDGHGHDAHEHAEGESAARFKAGVGLQLSAETAAAIGLQTGAVEDRSVQPVHELTASVFDAGPPARASALVPVALADELERHPPAEATILAIHRELAPAMSQVEIVLALPGALRLPIDAVPDITNVQVQINTAVPASRRRRSKSSSPSPSKRDGGHARMTELRSLSKFGLSQVTSFSRTARTSTARASSSASGCRPCLMNCRPASRPSSRPSPPASAKFITTWSNTAPTRPTSPPRARRS
jgi:hypothetical protein